MVIQRIALYVCALALLVATSASHAAIDAAKSVQTAMHLLDYIGVDYPAVVRDGQILNADEYKEQAEFAGLVRNHIADLPDKPARAELLAQADRLTAAIQDKQASAQVTALTAQMRSGLAAAYAVVTAPSQTPDMQRAAQLFSTACSGCHGAEGRGDGMLAASMQPAPSNFHNSERMNQLSAFALYSTISLGVEGTGMRAFTELSESDRWALALYAHNFATDAATKSRGEAFWRAGKATSWFPSLASTTNITANDAASRFGADAPAVLAYLQANPTVFDSDTQSPLAFSKAKLRDSVAAYRAKQHDEASQLAVTAYLEGFELIESKLDTVDRPMRNDIEREMMRFRNMIKENVSEQTLAGQADKISGQLDLASKTLASTSTSSSTNLMSAFIILLREGVEAILILGGIVVFLIRTDRRDALLYVHAGWIGALILGVFTWFIASYFISISGASREMTEGVTALISATVLLYVGYWLHGKIYAQRWHQYISTQLKSAMKSSTMWGLALLSFLTVYREVFETVLFYQALWAQAGAGARMPIIYGFLAAAGGLAIIAWLVFAFGVRLPLKLFFGVSSVMIGLLAVIFVGKGIAALQEAGKVPMNPLDVPSVPALGIYPNMQGVFLQAVILALIIGSYLYAYYSAQRAPQSSASAS